MRILSEEEMDGIFGGQNTSTVIPTLPGVKVTAPRLYANSGGYWVGGGGGFGSYDESATGSSGGSYYDCGNPNGTWCRVGAVYKPQPALPSIPTPEKLQCIMHAAAVPGTDLRSDYRFAVVNSYGYYNYSNSSLLLYSTQVDTPAGFTSVNGLTQMTGKINGIYNGTATIYAGGMDGTGGGNATYGSYYDDAGSLVNSYALGPMSGIEEAVLTAAHEARHQYTELDPGLLNGRDKEADARTYGIKALQSFRAGNGQTCN